MPQIKMLDIAACSIYYDETGGDSYDFLEINDCNPDCIGIAVGDVSGHSVPAALLMATVRAFFKTQSSPARRRCRGNYRRKSSGDP
jgi:sigma-B regulation protein RsbU (phosphoserine phosphatase)